MAVTPMRSNTTQYIQSIKSVQFGDIFIMKVMKKKNDLLKNNGCPTCGHDPDSIYCECS
jgi:hypothetical protein